MPTQVERLEASLVKSEDASDILYRFTNDPASAAQIPTDNGPIKNLAQLIADIASNGGDNSAEIAALQAAADAAVAAGSTAQSSANAASQSATQANLAATSAATTSQSALNAAQSANTLATTANTAAASAQTSANSALSAASAADAKATSAGTVASNAATAAAGAQTSADNAGSAAATADVKAVTAKTAADAAAALATTANTNAQTGITNAASANTLAATANTAATTANTAAATAQSTAIVANQDGPGLRYVCVGSSYTQMSSGWSALKITNGTRGRTPWLNFTTNQMFEYEIWRAYHTASATWRLIGCNQGYGGQLTSDIVARKPNILALKPDIIDLQISDNDHSTLTAAQSWAILKPFLDDLLAAGVKQIWLHASYPRLTTLSGWPAGNVARKRRHALNKLKRAYCQGKKGMRYINADQFLLDPANVNGEAYPNYLYDGIHMVQIASYGVYQAEQVGAVNQLSMPARVIAVDDLYDAVENPNGNIVTNPTMLGATGATSGTGQYPTGWANNSSGTGVSQVITTLATGELQIVITTTGAGAVNEAAYGGITFVVPGTFGTVESAFKAEFVVSSIIGPAVLRVGAQIRASGTVDGAAKTYYAYDMENYPGTSTYQTGYTSYWPCQTVAMSGVTRTPALVTESSDTALRCGIQVYINPSVAGTTTLKLKGGGLFPVELPWVKLGVDKLLGIEQAPATETQV